MTESTAHEQARCLHYLLSAAGGAVAYLTAWMDREATTKRYRKMEQLWRQGDLLDRLALTDEDRDV